MGRRVMSTETMMHACSTFQLQGIPVCTMESNVFNEGEQSLASRIIQQGYHSGYSSSKQMPSN